MDPQLPFLMLALAEGCDEAPVAALLDPSADPAELLRAPPPDLPPRVTRRLLDPSLREHAAAVRRRARDLGQHVLTPADPAFPVRLRHAPLRPLVLFAHGDLAALAAGRPAVAVVGSRTPTPYGIAATADFGACLAAATVTLWSGLARGIDAEAHRQSLEAGTPTVAVLAGGLDRVYPAEHAELAHAIAAAGGVLLGEAPPGTRARRGHFVRRNRILAGACQAVLVVEAGSRSGALHTARFGADAGALVFAVPGPYGSELSRGCHQLIAEGAQIAADPVELLRDLGLQPAPSAQAALGLQGSADEQAVLRALRAGPRPQDLLQRECGLTREAFLKASFALRSRGALRVLPGDLLAPG